jgi:hypothetical protein
LKINDRMFQVFTTEPLRPAARGNSIGWFSIKNHLRAASSHDTPCKRFIAAISFSPRRVRAAAALVNTKLAEGRACFSISKLIDKTRLSHAAAQQQLLRLGCVRRTARTQDFFIVVRPEEQVDEIPTGSRVAGRLF